MLMMELFLCLHFLFMMMMMMTTNTTPQVQKLIVTDALRSCANQLGLEPVSKLMSDKV